MAYNSAYTGPQVDSAVGQVVGENIPAGSVKFTDGQTFQQKYDAGQLTGPQGSAGENGATGPQGEPGQNATINGVNALTISVTGGGITGTQSGDTFTLDSSELFTSVSEGKSAVAAAITDKGVETAADATFQQMAENIGAIESGGIETVTGSYSGNMRGSAHLAWSDGETFHYLEVGSSSRTMVVMKNSIAILRNQNFASFTVSGGAEYIGYSGGYFITGDFSVAAQ